MTLAEKVTNFLKANPDCSTKQIAAGIGLPVERIQPHMSIMFKRGWVTRTVLTRTPSGVASYAYRVPAGLQGLYAGDKPRAFKVSPPSKQSNLSNLSLDTLLNQVAQAVAAQVLSKIETHVVAGLGKMLSATPPTAVEQPIIAPLPSVTEVVARLTQPSAPAVTKSRLPKALIVGMTPTQSGQLVEEFGSVIDLEFWNDRLGDGMERLKALSKAAHRVFVHIEHCAHKHVEMIKSVGGDPVYVKGGTSQMKTALTQLYVDMVPA